MIDSTVARRDRWSSERIEAERAKFKRIILAFQDLEELRASQSYLVKVSAATSRTPETAVQIDALVTSIVVGYGRCFTPTRARVGAPSLPSRFANSLCPDLRQLHDRILHLRNTEFAHSDVEVADVRVTAVPEFRTGALLPEARRLRKETLSEIEVGAISELLSALHIYLYDELVRLNEALARYGDF